MIPDGTVVKVGDELIIKEGGTYANKRLVPVKRLTPSGQIVINLDGDDYKFNADGSPINRKRNPHYLSLPTPEVRKEIIRQSNLNALIHAYHEACRNERVITDDQLERISAILNEKVSE